VGGSLSLPCEIAVLMPDIVYHSLQVRFPYLLSVRLQSTSFCGMRAFVITFIEGSGAG
jgi:hypothetical protein